MSEWSANLNGVVLAPGQYLRFEITGKAEGTPLLPLATGDTFILRFHGALLSGSVITTKLDAAIIAIEGARYSIKRDGTRWLIADRA